MPELLFPLTEQEIQLLLSNGTNCKQNTSLIFMQSVLPEAAKSSEDSYARFASLCVPTDF